MKNILIAIVIVILAVLALVYWKPASKPSTETAPAEQAVDTTGAIEADLGAIDVGDLDSDFKSLDADVSSL